MLKKYLYYFIKKISEKSRRGYYEKYYSREITEYKNETDKKSPSAIKAEMKALRKYWNVYPYQYFRYRLYRKDCNLTIEQMKDYVPDYFAYYILFPKSFKERNILCEDKRLFSAICKGYDISQPQLLFSLNKGLVTDCAGNTVTPRKMIETISLETSPKIFFKPTYGVGGRGILVFIKKGDKYVGAADNEELSESFINSISPYDYVVQAGLIQHEAMDELYPGSINTFRIITRCREGHVNILFSLLRLGQHGNHVDNASVGGMYTRIDTENGVLYDYAISGPGSRIYKHPDTGFVFANYKIPFWDEIIKFAEHLALCFKEIEYIGWDIAYTSEGPSVIEGNNGPGIEIVQDWYGGIRKYFDIDNPKEMWYSNNYALKDL